MEGIHIVAFAEEDDPGRRPFYSLYDSSSSQEGVGPLLSPQNCSFSSPLTICFVVLPHLDPQHRGYHHFLTSPWDHPHSPLPADSKLSPDQTILHRLDVSTWLAGRTGVISIPVWDLEAIHHFWISATAVTKVVPSTDLWFNWCGRSYVFP